jgi:hypothetical protein
MSLVETSIILNSTIQYVWVRTHVRRSRANSRNHKKTRTGHRNNAVTIETQLDKEKSGIQTPNYVLQGLQYRIKS